MTRRPRQSLADFPMHIVHRGDNRRPCFFAEEDYRLYLDWLGECASRKDCRIHAYMLMPNHVHLLLSQDEVGGAGKLMKVLGQRYVQYVNRTYRKSGALWEGRFRSCLVQEESYLLTCMRYLEANPLRAGRVANAAEYQWSSHRANAYGEPDHLISPHPRYLALGSDAMQRQAAYRDLFAGDLEAVVIESIRQATNGSFALGDLAFAGAVAAALGRQVTIAGATAARQAKLAQASLSQAKPAYARSGHSPQAPLPDLVD